MSISYNGFGIAECRILGITGESALGGYLLRVRTELRVFAHDGERPQRLGQLQLHCTGARLHSTAGGATKHLARLFPSGGTRVVVPRPQFYEVQVELMAEMDGRQLAAVEELRRGNDVSLTLSFEGLVVGANGTQDASDQIPHRVPVSDWLVILKQCGFQESLLIEVPLAGPDGSPNLKKAADHLVGAQAALVRGRWRECVGECRDVLEALSLETGDPDDADGNWSNVYSRQRELDLASRMRVVRRSLKLLTHPARHVDEVTVNIEWQPEDAKFALAVAAAAVRRYSAGVQ